MGVESQVKQAIALPETGSFNFAALASGRRFDAAELAAAQGPLPGLVQEGGYLWGAMRDDNGTLYDIIRRFPTSSDTAESQSVARHGDWQAMGSRLVLLSSEPSSDGMQLRREPRHAVDSSELRRYVGAANTLCFEPNDGAAGNSMKLTLGTDVFSWLEDGVIDVTGTLAAPPLQWYLPGPRASLHYTTQTWLVEGVLAGQGVRGFLFWEQAWMLPGGRLYVDLDPLHDAGYRTWYSWANHWADGTSEVGHFLFGDNDFHVAIIGHSDGTITSAKSMDARIVRSADRKWHEGITYDIDGVPWVCEVTPSGRMVGLGPMPNPQQEGWMHRAEDQRQPDVWMAWGETVPGRD